MSTTINLTTVPQAVPLLTGNQLMIVEHVGGDMVYYRSTSNVGPQTNDGVLLLGQTTQFYSGPVWFASNSTAQIIVTYISSPVTPVVVPSPTGIAASDTANWQAALAAAGVAGGGRVVGQTGTYLIAPTSGGACLVPNNTTVVIPSSCTIQVPPNTTTANQAYNLFVAASDPAVSVHYQIDGVIDGNIANGNHGLSEFIFAINLSDGQDSSITGAGVIKNWRGEAIILGTGGANTNKRISIGAGGLKITNCGVKQGGDGGNPRQGISCQRGQDIWIDEVQFDTIGQYAIDFETAGGGDSFDNCGVGPNCTFRTVGANGPGGNVNFSAAAGGTINPNCRAYASAAAGTLPSTNPYVVPANTQRISRASRYTGDLTLNSSSFVLVPGALRPTVAAQPGDILRFTATFALGNVADNTRFDAATLSAIVTSINYFAPASGTPRGGGQPCWRYTTGSGTVPKYGSALYTVVAGDIVSGGVTVALFYAQDTGTNQTLYASASVLATAYEVVLENLGPGW